MVSYIVAIVMGVAAIQYAEYVDRRSNHQWCEIVKAVDASYKERPPETPSGQELAAEFARLKQEFGCE